MGRSGRGVTGAGPADAGAGPRRGARAHAGQPRQPVRSADGARRLRSTSGAAGRARIRGSGRRRGGDGASGPAPHESPRGGPQRRRRQLGGTGGRAGRAGVAGAAEADGRAGGVFLRQPGQRAGDDALRPACAGRRLADPDGGRQRPGAHGHSPGTPIRVPHNQRRPPPRAGGGASARGGRRGGGDQRGIAGGAGPRPDR